MATHSRARKPVGGFWRSAQQRRAPGTGAPSCSLGVHPCFNGPHVSSATGGSRLIHPMYRQAGWHRSSPWWTADGIRARYGMRHLPLADCCNAFIDSGLTMQHLVEPGTSEAVPHALAVKAVRLD